MDYAYQMFQGVAQSEVLSQLPANLKIDFLLEKYKKMVNNCIVIRVPSTAEINFAIANSILAVVKTSIYMDESYILKVGEISTRAVLLLEGNLNVITYNQNDNLGKFSPGDFYATDLGSDENVHFNERFFKKT